MSNDRQQFFPIHNILECAKDIIFTSKKLSKKSRALTPASRAKAPCLARPGGQNTLNATPPD